MRTYVGAMDGSATGGPWGGVKGFGFGESCCVMLCYDMLCYVMIVRYAILCCTYTFTVILEFRSRSRHCGRGSDGSGWCCNR